MSYDMPDSADSAFNQIEDNACKLDRAEKRWDNMKIDEKVIYFQENFGDEPIVDFLENDDDIMESIFAKLVADENE
tara:strand:- start:1171 stop:1398 length:228 start_codon:yes stop_codon:yes gene_type:complete